MIKKEPVLQWPKDKKLPPATSGVCNIYQLGYIESEEGMVYSDWSEFPDHEEFPVVVRPARSARQVAKMKKWLNLSYVQRVERMAKLICYYASRSWDIESDQECARVAARELLNLTGEDAP